MQNHKDNIIKKSINKHHQDMYIEQTTVHIHTLDPQQQFISNNNQNDNKTHTKSAKNI